MDLAEFWTICSSNSIVLSKEQLTQFKRYHDELIYWNSKVNLISRKDEENLLDKHILHSLTALKYIKIPKNSRCLDIGTGGGLPGIPLAIATGNIYMTLVDSIAKKVKITDMLANHTGLRNISAICCRVEELQKVPTYSGKFDFIFARAVAKTDLIITWVRNLLTKTGIIVLYKGGNFDDEITQVKQSFPHFKAEIHNISILGADWFIKDEKKLLIISNIN